MNVQCLYHSRIFMSVFDKQLVRESHPIIGTTLAGSVRLEFLESVLGPVLLQPGAAHKVFITAFISKCLKQVSAPALLAGKHR